MDELNLAEKILLVKSWLSPLNSNAFASDAQAWGSVRPARCRHTQRLVVRSWNGSQDPDLTRAAV